MERRPTSSVPNLAITASTICALKCVLMEAGRKNEMISRLQEKLSECEARFDAEARKRGFDPAQTENMALPSTLARLFTEREEIKAELEELAENQKGE